MLKRRVSSVAAIISKGWYTLYVYVLGTACIDIDTGHIIVAQIFVEHRMNELKVSGEKSSVKARLLFFFFK